MRFDVVTIFPEMLRAVTDYGISGRAVGRGLLQVAAHNPRDFTRDRHQTVDDRPYGGGPGMVMLAEPLLAAIDAAKRARNDSAPVIYLSPQGRQVDHSTIASLATTSGAILLAGRYEGVDERVLQSAVDEEWSIGDYVLSGGELPAMVIIDAVVRLLPGALGDEDSAREDSFVAGLLDCPHFTRPEDFHGMRVPEVLLSGNHEAIRRWRLKQSLGRTWLRRPELFDELTLTAEQEALLKEFQQECDER